MMGGGRSGMTVILEEDDVFGGREGVRVNGGDGGDGSEWYGLRRWWCN